MIDEFEATSKYYQYKREQKIQKIQSVICSSVMGCLLGAWVTLIVMINI